MKPRFQVGAATTLGMHDQPLADFADRDGTQKAHRHRLGLEPSYNTEIGRVPAEF